MKKMRSALAMLMVLATLCTALVGCGGNANNPLVGKWKDNVVGVVELEFKADGKVELNALGQTESATYSVDGNKVTIEGESTDFKVEGNTLTLTLPDFGEMSFTKQ